MRADRFAVLQAEAETIVKRLKAIDEKDERKILLAELHRILNQLDARVSLHDRQHNK